MAGRDFGELGRAVDLLDLDRQQLAALLQSWGEPAYRAAQLWAWLYRHLATSAEEMTDLPASLRARLERECSLAPLQPLKSRLSADGATEKILFRLPDGQTVETVLMGYAPTPGTGQRRRTVCVSTQVGCAIGCPFCATGQSGFVRDLTAGEIVAQVLHFERQLKASPLLPPTCGGMKGGRVTNVVLMGMGEPLANYRATWRSIVRLNDPAGFGLGARRMTLSTVGLVPGIRRMAAEPLQVGLAVSLHAPTDPLRDRLVPINRRYSLAQLMAACREYARVTKRRVTFEYALINGVNDAPEQAAQLADLLADLLCHVNLIPLNPTGVDEQSLYSASPRAAVMAFRAVLLRRGVPVSLRLRRGLDIQAGCGQLRGRPG
jgi:23S rRNA (adenine2503-C2)-methyltransferase